MGISSSRATNRALSFSAIVLAATNPSEDMLMDMASAIGMAEGRSSSDLIKATSAPRGSRGGWPVFVAVLLGGGALDDEVARSWW